MLEEQACGRGAEETGVMEPGGSPVHPKLLSRTAGWKADKRQKTSKPQFVPQLYDSRYMLLRCRPRALCVKFIPQISPAKFLREAHLAGE